MTGSKITKTTHKTDNMSMFFFHVSFSEDSICGLNILLLTYKKKQYITSPLHPINQGALLKDTPNFSIVQ